MLIVTSPFSAARSHENSHVAELYVLALPIPTHIFPFVNARIKMPRSPIIRRTHLSYHDRRREKLQACC